MVSVWERAALGVVPGVQYFRLEGWNEAITTTFEVVWGESSAYTPLTAAMSTPYIASSSANDTSAGTGARTVRIKGMTTAFARFTEDLTMNGQTSVNLVTTNVLLVDSIEVLTAGSGVLNAGVIRVGTGTNTSGVPAVVHQHLQVSSATAIPAAGAGGGNITKCFMYGVPANKTLLMRNISYGSVFATAAAGMDVAIDGYTNSTGILKRYFIQMSHNTGANPAMNPTLIAVPEKTIILGKLAGVTGSNTGPASLAADCLLIDLATSNNNQVIF